MIFLERGIMTRIVNNPDFVVEDMLKGFIKANKHLVTATENSRVIKYINAPVEGKVGIVTGGGSGHKPAFIGYIGKNRRRLRSRSLNRNPRRNRRCEMGMAQPL